MIRIIPQEEPPGFYENIGRRGAEWLKTHNPKASLPPLWLQCSGELYNRYRGICAYSATWISELGAEVDHFKPKSKYRHLAYTWSNYRLASSRINKKKREKLELLDPFEVPDGAFRLRLFTGKVYIDENVFTDAVQREHARNVLRILPMDILQRLHLDWLHRYIQRSISEEELLSKDPFLYTELKRQRLI